MLVFWSRLCFCATYGRYLACAILSLTVLTNPGYPRALNAVSAQTLLTDQTTQPQAAAQGSQLPPAEGDSTLLRAPRAKGRLQRSYKSSAPLPRQKIESYLCSSFLWNQVEDGLRVKGHLRLLSLSCSAFITSSEMSFNLSFAQKFPSQALLEKNPR